MVRILHQDLGELWLEVSGKSGGVELIDQLAEEWRELCDTGPDDEPFYRPEWVSAYLRAFAPQATLLVISVRREGRLTGVVPLVEEWGLLCGLPVKRLRPPANVHSCRSDVVRGPKAEGESAIRAVWEFLRNQPGWHLIDLPVILEDGALAQMVRLAQGDGFRGEVQPAFWSAYLPVPLQGPATEPWVPGRKPDFRAKLRRRVKKLAAEGPLDLRHFDQAGPNALQQFYDLEVSGWKGREGSAIACAPQTKRFYDEIAQAAERFGYLSLDFVESDGRTIAGHFGLKYRNRYFLPKAAYDEDFRQYGPGHLGVHLTLQQCQQLGIREFDFVGPWAPDEAEWTLQARCQFHAYIFQKGLYGRLLCLLQSKLVRLVRTIQPGHSGAAKPVGLAPSDPMTWFAHYQHRVREIWKQQGARGIFYLVSSRILRPLLTWEILYVYEADIKPWSPPPARKEEFAFKLCSGEECLEKLRAELCPTGAISGQTVETRLKRGDVVAVAYAAGQFAGFSWISFNDQAARQMEPTLALQPDEAYQFDTFVVPRWRGHRLQTLFHRVIGSYARNRGCVRTLSYVDFWNRPSIKTQVRMGKRKVQTVVSIRFRGMKRPWTKVCGSRTHSR
jgi:CelD/BcsL family acetyltransferase involved in cellulose biosynthesis/GNAT superfamily N-acetyltransferase